MSENIAALGPLFQGTDQMTDGLFTNFTCIYFPSMNRVTLRPSQVQF